MNTQPESLRLAEILSGGSDQFNDEAAAELRRLYELAMDQHSEIYGLRLQVRNLLYALKYHQEQTRPIQRTIDAIAKAEAA